MAKKVSEDDLPSADVAPVETPETPAADSAPAVDSDLPLFLVESNGLQSESFHAVDESDAVRQFYQFHKIADTASRAHRARRVS